MKLSPGDLRSLIEKDFAGDLLYPPVHVTQDDLARPIAQLTHHLHIPAEVSDLQARSLTRKQSGLHIKGILHHDPDVPAKTVKMKDPAS